MTRLPADYRPEYDSLKALLLEMANARSFDQLLEVVVDRLAARPHVALVRIWLKRPGDICAACPKREICPENTTCLHLVASDGQSLVDPALRWNRIDGVFRRFPMGKLKVGKVAETGQTMAIWDVREETEALADPEWAEREELRGLGVQPLRFKDEILGTIAMFTRTSLDEQELLWLRMVADHLGSAITMVRAFAEIENLKQQLELENEYLREEVSREGAFGEIIGDSPALQRTLRQIEQVAPTNASVLILGESGTGKELIAREIHRRSTRCTGPLIKVNCAAIPKELYESEFFGHVRGSFSGAVRDRAGRFQAADGGTLFLDEIGEIPSDLQSKLLRVLQEGAYERVGEERTRTVDVRIVAATNRDLRSEMEAGRFRQDLYYRINVFPIDVEPLRRRTQDIPPLALHFSEIIARRMNRPTPRLTVRNVRDLQRYDWPGNVRELQNVMERAIIVSPPDSLRLDLPTVSSTRQATAPSDIPTASPEEVLTDVELQELVRSNIVRALEHCGWRVAGSGGAAELLGLSRSTLGSRMHVLGITRPGD